MTAPLARSAGKTRRSNVREGLQKIACEEDTIVAISTPPGRSGIGVVRLSGPSAEEIGRRFFRGLSPLAHRQAVVGSWQDSTGTIIDQVVVILYKGPHSYTGEDVLEISTHGSPLILHQVVCMIQSAGARAAAPGEFTLRAVARGKIDLIQAEAVRDFVEAQTDMQAKIAMRQMEGVLSKRIAPVKDALVGLIAHMEAGIDFAEDDVQLPNVRQTADRLKSLRSALETLQGTYSYGRLLSIGVRVVIAGKPNVGKSSLFNRLLNADRAIVTQVPGTTRDILSEPANLDGIPLQVFDTAGVRETEDVVEKFGVTRALEAFAEADLVLLVIDGSLPLSDEDRRVHASIRNLPHLVVANKADLPLAFDPELEGLTSVRVSAKTGENMDALREAVRNFLGSSRAEGLSDVILTTARQNEAVGRAIRCLQSSQSALTAGIPHEMVLLDLYEALSALNELTGDVVTEDILGRIFSTFCIGK